MIIGTKAYSGKWMKWEIERAKQADVNLKFTAVKISAGNAAPSGLPSTTILSNEFKLDKIITALNIAKRSQ